MRVGQGVQGKEGQKGSLLTLWRPESQELSGAATLIAPSALPPPFSYLLLRFLPLSGLSRSFRPTLGLLLLSFLSAALAQSVIPVHSAFGYLHLFFFLIAGCIGSLGYWQSLATRESKKQHQWYCIPKESQVPIHYDLRHHNLCMTERMVH